MADLGQRISARGCYAPGRRAVLEQIVAQELHAPDQESAGGDRRPSETGAGRTGTRERLRARLHRPRRKPTARPRLVEAGTTYPLGWPERAVDLPPSLASARLRWSPCRASRQPHGEARDALLAAGVRAWACVLNRPGRFRGIMAFDGGPQSCRRIPPGRPDETGWRRRDQRRRAEFLGATGSADGAPGARASHAAVGSLASVAHNFNNVIAAILGYAELAEEQLRCWCGPRRLRRDTSGGRARTGSDRQRSGVRTAVTTPHPVARADAGAAGRDRLPAPRVPASGRRTCDGGRPGRSRRLRRGRCSCNRVNSSALARMPLRPWMAMAASSSP